MIRNLYFYFLLEPQNASAFYWNTFNVIEIVV
jgi:hypothetical protein